RESWRRSGASFGAASIGLGRAGHGRDRRGRTIVWCCCWVRGRAMYREHDRVKVWDLPLRLFHWTLVAAIALALLSSEEGSGLNKWHVLSGWVAGLLIVFRLIWGVVGGEHSRFSDFIRPSRIG